MSADVESRVRRLFELAAAAGEQERLALLEDAARTDPEVGAEVASLLEHHDRTDALIDRPPELALSPGSARGSDASSGGRPAPEAESLHLPARLGSYALLRVIGSGGMGVVYEAEQASPRRRVAMKLIRPELVSASMLRRFEHEAEALGMLTHPGIAQVYEAGRAALEGEDGEPLGTRAYIAMELVCGPPLTEHAAAEKMGMNQRLALMAQVCDAIDSAHRRGVIHRDLKPGNILVAGPGGGGGDGGVPRPKVLDFGVARLVGDGRAGGEGGTEAGATAAGQIVGTLAYMSPEQAAGDPQAIDTRSDVYSLGAILFELLCGRPPIDVSRLSLHGALAAIQSSEVRFPRELHASVGADARAIALKALEKDPARRYQHASELAADIRRSLRREPILAREPSAAYRAARFCSRNKELVGAAVIVVASLVAAVVAVSAALVRAERARDAAMASAAAAEAARLQAEANEAAATANMQRFQAVSAFLHWVLRSARPEVSRGADTTLLRAMLATAEEQLPQLEDQPAALADACGLLASVYRDLGEFARSEPLARRSLDLYLQTIGEDDSRTMTAMHNLGALYRGSLRELDKAEPLLTRAAELFVRHLGADHPESINARSSLALLLMDLGRYAEAEPVLRELMETHARVSGSEHPATLRATHNYAGALNMQGRYAEAASALRSVHDLRVRLLGEDHPETVNTLQSLGAMLRYSGDAAAALPLMERTVELRERVMGPSHQFTLAARAHLANTLRDLGRLDDAARVAEEVAGATELALGPEHPDTLQCRSLALEIRVLLGRCDGAAAEAEELRARLAPKVPPGSYILALGDFCRGMALACAGDETAGEAVMLDAYEQVRDGGGGAPPHTPRRMARLLADFYTARGREAEAATWRQRANTPGSPDRAAGG